MKHIYLIALLLSISISAMGQGGIPLYQLEAADTTNMIVVTYTHPSGDHIQHYVHLDSLDFQRSIDNMSMDQTGVLTLYSGSDSLQVNLSSLHQQYTWTWNPTTTGQVNISRKGIDGSVITEQFHLEPRNIEVSGSNGLTILSIPNGNAWESDDSRTLHQIDVKNRFRTAEINDSTMRVYLEHKNGFFYEPHDSFDIVTSTSAAYDDSALVQSIIDSTAAVKQYADDNDDVDDADNDPMNEIQDLSGLQTISGTTNWDKNEADDIRLGAAGNTGVADWGDVTNTLDGGAPKLLLGTDTGGPQVSGYFHCVNYQYSTSGNVTQMAVPYFDTGSLWIRTRYNGIWYDWKEILDSNSVLWEEGVVANQAYFSGTTTNAEVGINTSDPEYTLDIHSQNNLPMRILSGGSAKDADILFQSSIGDKWTAGITHAVYDHFTIQGYGLGSGMLVTKDNEFGFGGYPLIGRKLHINGDFGVGVGSRFYFGTTTTQSRLNAPSSTSFAVENGSIEMLRLTRIGTNDAYLRIPQYSVNGTADNTPAYGFADEAGMGLYRRNMGTVGLTVGAVGRFHVDDGNAYFPDYANTRNDGVGLNYLYTDSNGKQQSGQIDDLFTANQLTAGNFIGITSGVINNLAPTPFAYGSGNNIFSNVVGRNFGLGTSTPSTTLDVHGGINFTRKNDTSGTIHLDYGAGSQWTTITPNYTYLDFQTSSGGEIRMQADTLRINSVFKDADGDKGSANQVLGFDTDGKLNVVDNNNTQTYGGLERSSGIVIVTSTASTKVNFTSVVGTSVNTTPSTSSNDITVDQAGEYRLLVKGFVFDYTTNETLQLEVRVNGIQVEDFKLRGFEDNEIYIDYISELALSANDDIDIYIDSTADSDYAYNSFKMTLIKVN